MKTDASVVQPKKAIKKKKTKESLNESQTSLKSYLFYSVNVLFYYNMTLKPFLNKIYLIFMYVMTVNRETLVLSNKFIQLVI
jgi:hypothetical protein